MIKPVVLSVFGTRPEVIKFAPILQALARSPDVESRICVTAQHREMLDQMLGVFGLHPDYDLDLMEPDQDLSAFNSRALPPLQKVLREVRPDFLLVQGDTTTAFVTALAAFYERVPVGHVEAGLRTHDNHNPFPEEVNRVLVSHIGELHFAPTPTARENLLREGIAPRKIVLSGNTVVDALRWTTARPHEVQDPSLQAALSSLGRDDNPVVVTTHRRENLGKPLESVCAAFQTLVERHESLHLFYPVHLNPRVQTTVRRLVHHPRAHLLPALDYFDLIHLLHRSRFVITDSGGLQEEAPSLGKPVIVLRENTERPEGVQAGVARLAGTDPATIIALASQLLEDAAFYDSMSRGTGVFGDGKAGDRIVQSIRHFLGLTTLWPEDFSATV
jgi:UDP-N-acetylglucosamine 2-epimerase (non-hydrolysing)